MLLLIASMQVGVVTRLGLPHLPEDFELVERSFRDSLFGRYEVREVIHLPTFFMFPKMHTLQKSLLRCHRALENQPEVGSSKPASLRLPPKESGFASVNQHAIT